jgi:thiosulfate/3-mercaptopyruvate sulfurtransferase
MRLKTIARAAVIAAALMSSTAAFAELPAALRANQDGPGAYIDLADLRGFSDNVVIVDIRSPDRYAAGHIPGAINIPREQIETPEVNGVIGETKSYEELEVVFAAAGLTYDDRIVVYGEKDEGTLTPHSGRFAGKIYVSFDQAGFENVHILDGGVEGWDGDLSTEATVLEPTEFKLTNTKPYIIDKDYVLAALERDDVFVLDARGTSGYDKGHIPGSINVPFGLQGDANKLNDLDGLLAKLKELGVEKGDEIITTCGWGWAASDLLAVLRDLGYDNIKLYDGSWTEWVQDPELPKAGTDFS